MTSIGIYSMQSVDISWAVKNSLHHMPTSHDFLILMTLCRVSNLKYESVRIDSKTVVFIRANPGKKETTDGSGSLVNFFINSALFRK